MDIALHPKSNKVVEKFKDELPQSLLITGDQGIGLATIARHIACRNLTAFMEPMNVKGEIDHATGTIAIEAVRRLYEETRSKQTHRQVVVIDDADKMSPGAQAAFLKLLEEPPASAHFLLTSHAPQKLLPTIRSRVQSVVMEPISEEQTKAMLVQLDVKDAKKLTQLIFLASGLPAELHRLVNDEQYFAARAEIMSDARDFLTAPAYKRLLVVYKYHQDRGKTLSLIESAMSITHRTLRGDPKSVYIKKLDLLLGLKERIASNHNIRLQLMEFVL